MAFTFKGLLGAGAGRGQILSEADLEEPTTQVKMSGAQRGYDPLAAPSIMDQMRSASPEMKQPGRLWFIGHLPIARQYQILGVLLLLFGVLAGAMLWLNYRANSQAGASSTTATEMQMLSQRLARGTALARRGTSSAPTPPCWRALLRSGRRT